MSDDYKWWERGVIYQVYPRSFQDASGDGVGDLAGITARLGYLAELGVDAIWISPIYPSPMVDFGYDISDHCAIDPLFGSLADFDRLVEAAHGHGLKVVLDYVPNHTSDQHPWFLESRASRDNPRRDWYLWVDPAPDGGPPNNWRSVFGGPAWTLDERTGQYYYHAYVREQPDLNWRNPEVRAAMLDVLRFWLERGVDGFRVDALRQVIKDDQLRDNPPNPDYRPAQSPYHELLPRYTTNRPEVHTIVALMREMINRYGDRLLIGELYLPIAELVGYYDSGLHLPFNFHLILTPWRANAIAQLIDEYENAVAPGNWPNWVLGNHDQHRLVTRVGSAQARVAGMLLLTLRGTPTLYYGDELGMPDVDIPPELVQDPFEKNVPGRGFGRDPERTPMQWDASPGAGFTTGRPWLPLAPDYQTRNVAAQSADPASMLALYRRLIALRRASPALSVGDYCLAGAYGDLLAYIREADEGARMLVVLNLGPIKQRFDPPRLEVRGAILLSTHLDREGEAVDGPFELRGDEGVVVRLDA